MKNYQIFSIRNRYFFLVLTSAIMVHLPFSFARATSRMGTVLISDSKELPCFSIPKNFETRNGLSLYGLFIKDFSEETNEEFPPTVWRFDSDDNKSPPTLMPQHCIRYGENPAGTTQTIYKPLELFHIYSVFLQAEVRGSSMIGYTGKFCIKPAGSGTIMVQVISEDQRLGDARFAVCANKP